MISVCPTIIQQITLVQDSDINSPNNLAVSIFYSFSFSKIFPVSFHPISLELQRISRLTLFSSWETKKKCSRRLESQSSDRKKYTSETSFTQGFAFLVNVSENDDNKFDNNFFLKELLSRTTLKCHKLENN